MNKQNFMMKVIEIYYRDNCTVPEAIDKAEKELNVTDAYVRELYLVKNKEGVENEVCPSLYE